MCVCVGKHVLMSVPETCNKTLYIQRWSWDEIYNISNNLKGALQWEIACGRDEFVAVYHDNSKHVLSVWKAALCSCVILTSEVWKGRRLNLADVRFTFSLSEHQLHPGRAVTCDHMLHLVQSYLLGTRNIDFFFYSIYFSDLEENHWFASKRKNDSSAIPVSTV